MGQEHDHASRRSVLKGLATLGIVAAGHVLPATAEARPRRHPGVLVYRLRTRDTRSCRACKLHHRYTVFRTRLDADQHRAHPGCNCPIEPQRVSKRQFRKLFGRSLEPNGVAHLPRPGGGDLL